MAVNLVSIVLQVMVNVPAISDRTIRRDIASSGVTIGSDIQVCTCAYPLCVIIELVKVTYMYLLSYR